MASTLTDLTPSAIWRFFDEITRIPRPSKKEEKIIAYLIDFARRHALSYRQDPTGNVVILKKATPGMEKRSKVILQSHMDMVTEKNSDVLFDFEQDAIRTRIEEGWVKAEGTTLGADCGIGMAAALAILDADDLAHGPLECLFTVDEESGLTGAFGLGDDMLTGHYLINLDSEDEGELFIGCAGGIDTLGTFTYTQEAVPANYAFFRIDLQGLSGGHSGDDINKGRGNSNKLLSRFLRNASRMFLLRLSHFDGGNLRNAIPREAYAIFGVPTASVADMKAYFNRYRTEIRAEFHITEPGLTASLNEISTPDSVIDLPTQNALLNTLCAMPNGVLSMSQSIENFVETSTNLASVKFTDARHITVTTSQRSSVESAKEEAAASIEAVFELAGAQVLHSDGYPGWTPNPESHLLAVTCAAYERLFGVVPQVKAIHAGLECGLFLEKFPALEMVSFGPTLRGVHSPDERLEIASVDKFWKLLVEVLASLQ